MNGNTAAHPPARIFDVEILQDNCDRVGITPDRANCRRMARALNMLEAGNVRVDPSHMFSIVKSQTSPEHYKVSIGDIHDITTYDCTCPDAVDHHMTCKHQIAVWLEIENLLYDAQAAQNEEINICLSDRYDKDVEIAMALRERPHDTYNLLPRFSVGDYVFICDEMEGRPFEYGKLISINRDERTIETREGEQIVLNGYSRDYLKPAPAPVIVKG